MNTLDRKLRVKAAIVAALLASLMLTANPALGHTTHAYSYDSIVKTRNPDWMAYLPDQTPLSHMSIPATHDTMAYQCPACVIGDDWTFTQSLNLAQQLESGIRAFDLRLRYEDSVLKNHHGESDLGSTFGDVLATTASFLSDHPTEVVFIKVYRTSGTEQDWGQRFMQLYTDTFFGQFIYDDDNNVTTFLNPSNPTLGNMRGKIVFLTNFDAVNSSGHYIRAGLRYYDFDNGGDWDLTTKENLYDAWLTMKNRLINTDVPATYGDIYTSWTNATTDCSTSDLLACADLFELPTPWWVASGHVSPETNAANEYTGYTVDSVPDANKWADFPRRTDGCILATCIYYEGLNVLTMDYINDNNPTRTGMIFMDYPGPGLIDSIIDVNQANFGLVVDAGGPYEGGAWAEITFDASGSYSNYNSIVPGSSPVEQKTLWYHWIFDFDGVIDTDWSNDPVAAHAYPQEGNYTATLLVADINPNLFGGDLSTQIDWLTKTLHGRVEMTVVTITPAEPTGDVIDENQKGNVFFTLPYPGTPVEYAVKIDWGDGFNEQFTFGPGPHNVDHRYLDDTGGPYPVAISAKASGSDVEETVANVSVTVNNVAPVDNNDGYANPDSFGPASETTISGSFWDQGTLDTFTVTIDWGDGNTDTVEYAAAPTLPSASFQEISYEQSHVYHVSPGSIVITVTVQDDDGGEFSFDVPITVEPTDGTGEGGADAGSGDTGGAGKGGTNTGGAGKGGTNTGGAGKGGSDLSGAAGGSGSSGVLAAVVGALALAGGGYYLWQRRKASQPE